MAITLPAAANLSGSASDDGLPSANLVTTWSVVSGPGAVTFGNVNTLSTTASFSANGLYTLRLTASDGALTASDDVVVTVNAAASSSDIIYLSTSANGTVGALAYRDEDILAYDPNTNTWSLIFDGSDVGLSGVDVNAFTVLSDGSLLLSTDNPVTVSGAGSVDDSDILHFIPTSLGDNTAGSYELYFRGANVGLTTSGEDINAIDFAPDGRLLISTLDSVSVPGVSANDEDILAFTPTALGDATNGSWSLYFDGSTAELTASTEEIWGLSVDASGKLYLAMAGAFSVTGVSGTAADIFTCTPITLGANSTSCTYAPYWNGADHSFGAAAIDGMNLGGSLGISGGPSNQPPTANAGADQTITLPAAANLSGSASDDGLPSASLVTTWSVVSGPGAVTFGNINALSTTAGFAVNGVYTLRLTASDGALTASDDVAITVNPAPPVNQPPTANAGADQTITLPASASLSGSASDDGLPAPANLVTTWSVVSGPGAVTFGNINALSTTAGFAANGVYTLRLTASDGAMSISDDVVITVNAAASNSDVIYLSTSANGTVGSLSFRDEDILAFDPATNAWSLVFDGSDVGLSGVDVDAFVVLSDGSLLLSTDNPVTVNGAGSVDDSDILHFIPSSLGNNTAGSFQLYFRGADVGLTTSGEDINAIDFAPDGRLLISTLNSASVPGVSANDEDILAFTPTTPGVPTSGNWSLYFDGSTAELTASTEEIWGLSVAASGKLYLSMAGAFAVTGASGTAADIFTCTPISLGVNNTRCTYAPYWSGAAHGFGSQIIDGMDIGGALNTATVSAAFMEEAPEQISEADGDDDPTNGNWDDTDSETGGSHQVFLPVASK
ncbi:MAG: hypothetical protein R3A44_43285 [Caldilineaceae bacterium]